MSWWGKVIGGAFGFMLGGPLGAMLGAVLGHNLDKGLAGLDREEGLEPGERERVQMAFFTATFSVMGHVAKADGQVTRDEIALAESVMADMELSGELRQTAMRLFNEGKRPGFPLDEVLAQFRQECHRRQTLIQMFIEIQLQAALADGELAPAEEQLLLQLCERLGVSRFSFLRLVQMARAERHFAGARAKAGAGAGAGAGRRTAAEPAVMSLKDAHAILNVSEQADDAEVKKAYRRLISQHHPDKLVSKGLPEEMMKMATRKTHEIRQAYERIREARGF